MSKGTDWAKVGALAGVAGVAITLVTLVASHGSTSSAAGSGNGSRPTASNTTSQGQTNGFATDSSGTGFSSTGIVQPSGPPAGCQQAQAAITTFNNTVGSTWNSKLNASLRASSEIGNALESSGSGTVYDDLTAVYSDFEHMSQYAGGQQSAGYDSSAAQANIDTQQLDRDCGTG